MSPRAAKSPVSARYLRVSSQRQAEREIPLEGQRTALDDFERRHSLKAVHEYADDGYTGRNDERPGFQDLIRDAEARKFSVILVWKFDRFSRDFEDAFFYEARLKRAGVRLISITENPEELHEEPKDDDRLLARRFERFYRSHLAEDESRRIAQNVRRGLGNLAAQGAYASGKWPLGYKVEKIPQGKHFRRRLVVDEQWAPAVRRLGELALQGMTLRELSRQLEREGFQAPKAPYWRKSTLHQILTNEQYTGTLVWRPRDGRPVVRIEDAHPALIDRASWEKIQRLLLERRKENVHPRQAANRRLLSGLVRCGRCGHPVNGRPNYHGYICVQRQNDGVDRCSQPIVPIRVLEPKIVSWLGEFLQNDEQLRRTVEEANRVLTSQEEDPQVRRRQNLEANIARAEESAGRLLEAVERGLAEEAALPRINALHLQIAEWRDELLDLPLSQPRPEQVDLETWRKYAQHVPKAMASAPAVERQGLLREFVKRIDLDWPSATLHLQVQGVPAGTAVLALAERPQIPPAVELQQLPSQPDLVQLLMRLKRFWPGMVEHFEGHSHSFRKAQVLDLIERYRRATSEAG